jgi:hypothetical protein
VEWAGLCAPFRLVNAQFHTELTRNVMYCSTILRGMSRVSCTIPFCKCTVPHTELWGNLVHCSTIRCGMSRVSCTIPTSKCTVSPGIYQVTLCTVPRFDVECEGVGVPFRHVNAKFHTGLSGNLIYYSAIRRGMSRVMCTIPLCKCTVPHAVTR